MCIQNDKDETFNCSGKSILQQNCKIDPMMIGHICHPCKHTHIERHECNREFLFWCWGMQQLSCQQSRLKPTPQIRLCPMTKMFLQGCKNLSTLLGVVVFFIRGRRGRGITTTSWGDGNVQKKRNK